MIGPWIDSTQFRDLDLLEKLGRHNRDTAVGVLVNRNLTGAPLARVAEGANLIASNVEALGGTHLLRGRTPEDQVTIAMAAAARSEAAARVLAEHLCPQAALTLYRRTTATRFKGAAVLREGIVDSVRGLGYSANAHLPGYRELVESVLPTPTSASHIVIRAAGHYNDAEALCALAPLMAAIPVAVQPAYDVVIQELLLLTHGHPEVAAHWGRHGGGLGAQVAILDHRQDGEWLVELAKEHPQLQLNDALMANPAVPYEVRAQIRGDEFVSLLIDGGPQADHRISQLAWSSQKLIQNGTAFKGVDLSSPGTRTNRQHRAVVEAMLCPTLGISQLLRFEVLLNDKTPSNQRGQLIDLLREDMQGNWPGTMNQVLVDAARTAPPSGFARQAWLDEMDPSRNMERSAEEKDPTIQKFRGLSGVYYLPSREGLGHHGASAVAAQVTTIAAFEKLYEEVNRIAGDRRTTRRNTLLSTVLATVARETRLVAPDDAIYDLIPNALGAF